MSTLPAASEQLTRVASRSSEVSAVAAPAEPAKRTLAWPSLTLPPINLYSVPRQAGFPAKA